MEKLLSIKKLDHCIIDISLIGKLNNKRRTIFIVFILALLDSGKYNVGLSLYSRKNIENTAHLYRLNG